MAAFKGWEAALLRAAGCRSDAQNIRLARDEHAFAAALTSLEALGQEKRASAPRQTVAEHPAGKRSQRTGTHASGKLAASDLIEK